MRHGFRGRRFNRTAEHREAMFANMSAALIKHEQIVTTLPKAKDLRPVVEKLVTLGKRGDAGRGPAMRVKDMRLFLYSAFCLLLLAVSPARAFTINEVKSPRGITAWLVEDHTVPLIAMNFSFAGGTAGDPADKQGLGNFLTTMLDEGAGDLPSREFQTREQDLAMKLAFSADADNFRGSFQTLSKNRDDAFAMLAMALTAPRFDENPITRMRAELLQSLAQAEEQLATRKLAFIAIDTLAPRMAGVLPSTKGAL